MALVSFCFPREWWSRHTERSSDGEGAPHLFTVHLQFLILFLRPSSIASLAFWDMPFQYFYNKFLPFVLKVFQTRLLYLGLKRTLGPKLSHCTYNAMQSLCVVSWHHLVFLSFPTSFLSSHLLTRCDRSRSSAFHSLKVCLCHKVGDCFFHFI